MSKAELERVAPARPIVAPGYTKVAVVPGGAPGVIPVADIDVTDALVGVVYYPGAGTVVTDVINLTGQFTIPHNDAISNNGGADTSAGKLLVIVRDGR